MQNNPSGIIDKIRMLSYYPQMLVRFTILTNDKRINCICSDKNLCNSLLFLDEGKTKVAIYGRYNSRKQLVVEKMFIKNPTSFEKEFAVRCLA
ncbi:hypothetical protein DOK76_12480 [Vagococcus sp. DIV0080]|uniref:Uncharacterized protein n=1 Tax=Candidatus Vagococcus giribetii TaxID=2230876 RepID=A0ABS3HX19_9ENTE|nr:hypothetical protein [Vagococcus sp. DIV0080]MBO0477890.1 hypothetical protein [Vagococcus sp. DIV0080]